MRGRCFVYVCMERYNVRIALHGASPAIYDMLGEAITRMGGNSYADAGGGRLRRLRPGEYEFNDSPLDSHALLMKLQSIVRAVWIDSGIRVTGAHDTCSSGAEPIPSPPTEEGQRGHAMLP
jgi:hypothetical protein